MSGLNTHSQYGITKTEGHLSNNSRLKRRLLHETLSRTAIRTQSILKRRPYRFLSKFTNHGTTIRLLHLNPHNLLVITKGQSRSVTHRSPYQLTQQANRVTFTNSLNSIHPNRNLTSTNIVPRIARRIRFARSRLNSRTLKLVRSLLPHLHLSLLYFRRLPRRHLRSTTITRRTSPIFQ